MKFNTNAEQFKRLTNPQPSVGNRDDEEDIIFEDGDYWILFERNTQTYDVYYTPGNRYSHTKRDLRYQASPDGLYLAKERIKYLKKRREENDND